MSFYLLFAFVLYYGCILYSQKQFLSVQLLYIKISLQQYVYHNFVT